MTARVSKSFSFQTGVHFNNTFSINTYHTAIDFDIETESIREQNIALERIKYFLDFCLENSIFIDENETESIQKYHDADIKVCTLPKEPYDQIIGIMLMIKLNAISEGRLVATDITITSKMSDGVAYHHSIEENTGPFKSNGWWHENSLRMSNLIKPNKSKKVVKLKKSPYSWEELYLTWADPIEATPNTISEVVFANFDTKTDK